MSGIVWLVAAVLVIGIVWKRRKQARRGSLGSAAVGSIYDMLNEDKRNAVEIIVELMGLSIAPNASGVTNRKPKGWEGPAPPLG